MDGFDETKMKQLQLLKEKMKIAKAQKVEEVKKNEDVFSLSHDVKNVRSFETQDIRFNKIGKKFFENFTPNKKATHIKGTNSRYPFQQAKSGNANFPFKAKNGLIKLANEPNAFDTPLTFEEVMRRKNEKKKKELEKSGQNGMVDDMLNNVRQFNLSEEGEDKNESGLLQGMSRTYADNAQGGMHAEEEQHQANNDSHGGSVNIYGDMYSDSSPLRQLQEMNRLNNYDDAGGLHQSKLHDKATNSEQMLSGYTTDKNNSINGNISNNSSSFGMDVLKNSQSLSHGMSSFTNYFSQQVGKGQDVSKIGADLNRTSPDAVNNVGSPLSESFPGTTSAGSGVGGLFGSRGDLTNRSSSSGSNIFGCSLSKLNQTIFNQTVNIQSSSQGPSNNMHKGNDSNITPSASSPSKGDSAHSLFQSSANSTLGASTIFGTNKAPIGSNEPVTNSSPVPPSTNQSIEASSLFTRNDGSSNRNNTGSLFNNSFKSTNLDTTRNAPDAAGKNGLFNNASDGSGVNVFGNLRSKAHLFSGSGSIFGKPSAGTTNLFGIAANEKSQLGSAASEKNQLGSAANEKNTLEKANTGKGIFGHLPGSSNPFGNASGSGNPFGSAPGSGSNIFGTPANASINLFGKSSGGANLFNKSGGTNSTSHVSNANNFFGKPPVGSNIFGASSSSLNNVGAVSGLLSGNPQNTPDSRCGAPGENLLNTSSKLISDGPTNRCGLGSRGASAVTAPSQAYLSRGINGMQKGSDINARVMKFKNTLSNINSKRSGDLNEPVAHSIGENETQVDQTRVEGSPDASEQPPAQDPRGVEENDAASPSQSLQYQNVEQAGESNNDEAAQPTCDSPDGESAKASHDNENENDKEEGTNIRKTFSSYFNTFIPSIFSSPNKQTTKDEYPKGDTSNDEVKTENVEVTKNAHDNPIGKDASEGENINTSPLRSDKDVGEMKTFFRATPLRDPPNATLSSRTNNANTLKSNHDVVLLKDEKINEPLHFDPLVDSDKANSNNHEVLPARSQNEIRSHAVAEQEQIRNTNTAEGMNVQVDVNQNGSVNPLSDENNKTKNLFNHEATVPNSGTSPGMESKMNPTARIPFSNANVGRSTEQVATLPSSVIPSSEEKSGRSILLGNGLDNVKNERNSSSAACHVSSKVDEPKGIFQRTPSHNNLIEVPNADGLENKEDIEKMNQIYKNINCINKNISYINKYVPSTIEDVDNYLHENITSVQNYDALSSANQTCLEKMNAPNNSAQSNKELKNMINVLNKQIGTGGGPSGGGGDDKGAPIGKAKGTLFFNPFNRGSQVDMTHNAKAGLIPFAPDGEPSRCTPIFNATGKHTPGGNFLNTKMLTPTEKLKLINETSKGIETNEESDVDEKIPEHVQKIMERREYFKTKNTLTNSDSNKNIGMKKIKPFVPSECSESFRNTFYTNENSKNKNNVFSLQNLSSMNILSPNQGSSIGAAALGTYPTVDNRSTIFKDFPVETQNKREMHTYSSENFFMYNNMAPSSSNTIMNSTFASENAQNRYNPLAPTKNFNSAVNSGELTSRVHGGVAGGETKPSGESLIKMQEELNRQTDFISNIYTSLGKNNFIYDNRREMDSTRDEQRGDHGDDELGPAATNTDDASLKKRSLDCISGAHDDNDDVRDDESNPFDNIENGDDDDPTCARKKKRKFATNGINEELLSKDNRCIDISNCVKDIRDSTTLEDISTNLSKYTVESERILCDIINDTFKMSLKISSLSDLPFLFEDFP
ncbi:hypothetical protein AK88_01573 [Plasmodium fragile]|uniref:Uncharacterized protein n=1 Tax=Plasmodium fragile TaxID=5857 RepID=A0A0D9QPI8_PLAFR|nr:uncharacterized protein AK88_01573 [Plasmodium fragile]KJP88692.1 hypothetical protein AK88_01573 [Plasmodium fragile]